MKVTTQHKQAVAAFAEEFFKMNPGASSRDCLKAVNNARLPPIWEVVEPIHRAHTREKLAAMVTAPSKDAGPRGAQPNTPPQEEPAPMADNKKPTDPTADALKTVGRQLLEVMRANGIESLTLLLTDGAEGPSLDFDASYRQRTSGKVTL